MTSPENAYSVSALSLERATEEAIGVAKMIEKSSDTIIKLISKDCHKK